MTCLLYACPEFPSVGLLLRRIQPFLGFWFFTSVSFSSRPLSFFFLSLSLCMFFLSLSVFLSFFVTLFLSLSLCVSSVLFPCLSSLSSGLLVLSESQQQQQQQPQKPTHTHTHKIKLLFFNSFSLYHRTLSVRHHLVGHTLGILSH